MTTDAPKTIDHLRIEESDAKDIGKKMEELNLLKADIDLEQAAKKTIEELPKEKLATFIEKQFKNGDNWKSYQEVVGTPFYTFAVQAALDALDYDKQLGGAYFGVDGVYGSRTIAAVKAFQTNNQLDVDGFVGPQTFAKMVELLRGSKNSEVVSLIVDQNLITQLNLKEHEKFIDYGYYGIPDNAKIYTRAGYAGYYFFNDNTLTFVPDLKKNSALPVIQKFENNTRKSVYPSDSSNFSTYFNQILGDKLPGSNANQFVAYENGQYFVHSFGRKTPIQLDTLTKGRIIDGGNSNDRLKNNLGLLSLSNYLVSKRMKGVKLIVRNGDIGTLRSTARGLKFDVLLKGDLLNKNYPFLVGSNGLSNANSGQRNAKKGRTYNKPVSSKANTESNQYLSKFVTYINNIS